jgi:hypothetical protein
MTLVQYSPTLVGEKLRKSQVFLNGTDGSKCISAQEEYFEGDHPQ